MCCADDSETSLSGLVCSQMSSVVMIPERNEQIQVIMNFLVPWRLFCERTAFHWDCGRNCIMFRRAIFDSSAHCDYDWRSNSYRNSKWCENVIVCSCIHVQEAVHYVHKMLNNDINFYITLLYEPITILINFSVHFSNISSDNKCCLFSPKA